MKSSQYTDSQIIKILETAQGGMPIPELCREHGMSRATFYKWRAKYGSMDVFIMKRQKSLRARVSTWRRCIPKNGWTQIILWEPFLEDKVKKVVKPSQRREMAHYIAKQRKLSISKICKLIGISETCFRYKPILCKENKVIADWLIRLTSTYRNWGFGLCFLYLRNVKRFHWNHKRVYPISLVHFFKTGSIFNTDQGAQYTSEDFTKVLKSHKIKIFMDGQCADWTPLGLS